MSWMDKLRRKQKSGVTQGHTLREMLVQNQLRDAYGYGMGDLDGDSSSEADKYQMEEVEVDDGIQRDDY